VAEAKWGSGRTASFKWTSEKGGSFFAKGYGSAFALSFHMGVSEVTKGMAQQVQEYAQTHAPWEDQTGDARDGLTAEGDYSFYKYTIVLYHVVDYGIWLEIRWNGRWAIIMPTLEHYAPIFVAELQMAEILKYGALSSRVP
jgi:hypothetical protein